MVHPGYEFCAASSVSMAVLAKRINPSLALGLLAQIQHIHDFGLARA